MTSGLDFRFKGFDQYTDTIDSDRLIIEYESLHRTDRLYDIIIIDEVRSVLTSATTYATNRSSLARSMKRLKMNMAHAKKVILSDADSDLDGAVQYFIHNNFESYTGIRLEKPVMRRKYRLMKKNKSEKTMLDDIKRGASYRCLVWIQDTHGSGRKADTSRVGQPNQNKDIHRPISTQEGIEKY